MPLNSVARTEDGCFAMTEPGGAHGGGGCDIENLDLHGTKIRTKARLEGNEWVINGQKMWASNEGVADLYCVVCTTDPNLGDEGVALIYVPKDTKGITFGKNENKAGMAGDKNHPMFLENVRVPKEWRAAGPGVDARTPAQQPCDRSTRYRCIGCGPGPGRL